MCRDPRKESDMLVGDGAQAYSSCGVLLSNGPHYSNEDKFNKGLHAVSNLMEGFAAKIFCWLP